MVDGGLAVDDGFGSAGSFDDVDGRVRNCARGRCRRLARGTTGLTTVTGTDAGGTPPGLPEGRPSLLPALITLECPQRQHWIDVGARPVHPTPLQPGLDQQLVGALHTPTADRIPRRDKGVVAYLLDPRGQIVVVLLDQRPRLRPAVRRFTERREPIEHLLFVAMA